MYRIETILQKHNIPHELIYHDKQIHTAQEGAEYFGIDVGQTAPTLILKTDKGFYILIFSGGRGRVDLEKVGGILGCEKVKLASPKEVQKVTGYTVGSVSMIGIPLPCIIDKQLFSYSFIYGGTGAPNCTLKISPDDLVKLNQVVAMLDC